MKLGAIGRENPEGYSRQRRPNLRAIPRQLSLRETEFLSSSFEASALPRRHNSDEPITRPRRAKSTSSSNKTAILLHRTSKMPMHRLPSQRFRREANQKEPDYSQRQTSEHHNRGTTPRDRSPQKPSRHVVYQCYDNTVEDDDCSDYGDSGNDINSDGEGNDEFLETLRSSRRLSVQDDKRRRHQFRSASCRHFGADPTLNQITTKEHQARKQPLFKRSMSEHSIGGHFFRNHGERNALDEFRQNYHIEGEEDQPRRRYHPSENISVSLSHNCVHSVHVRSPTPALSRGPSRRSLRAQNSLQSISESGDALSDLTGERSSNKTSTEEAAAGGEEPASPLQPDTDASSSNSTNPVDLTSRRSLRILSYGRLEKAVEIAPGLYMRLRDANETWDAIEQGNFVSASCGQCEQDTIYCIDSASFVSCPRCKHITAIDCRSSSGGGVGLGFTPSMFRACNLVGSRFVSRRSSSSQ